MNQKPVESTEPAPAPPDDEQAPKTSGFGVSLIVFALAVLASLLMDPTKCCCALFVQAHLFERQMVDVLRQKDSEELIELLDNNAIEINREAEFVLIERGEWKLLLAALEDSRREIRGRAVRCLVCFPEKEGVLEGVRKLTRDNSRWVRARAVYTLGAIGNESDLPMLEVLAAKPYGGLTALNAEEAIERIRKRLR